MTEIDNEFAFLPGDAAALGLPADLPPVRRASVEADGRRVDALVWGDEAPRIALLHGAGLNAHTWDGVALALGRPAVALDLPGHGDSAWRDDVDYRPATLATAVADALDELAPAADVVVGQSLGGLTGAALLGARPDLVRRLVLVDVTPGITAGDAAQVSGFLAGPPSFASRDEVVDRALEFGFGPTREAVARGVHHNTRITDEGRVVWKHHFAELVARAARDPESLASVPFDVDLTALFGALETGGVPILLIRGDRGYVTDAAAAELLDRVPGSRAVTVASGHNVQEDAPVELARLITTFIDETS